jgi:hypothetical protein
MRTKNKVSVILQNNFKDIHLFSFEQRQIDFSVQTKKKGIITYLLIFERVWIFDFMGNQTYIFLAKI